jgi:hypothetical protein
MKKFNTIILKYNILCVNKIPRVNKINKLVYSFLPKNTSSQQLFFMLIQKFWCVTTFFFESSVEKRDNCFLLGTYARFITTEKALEDEDSST